MADDDYLGFRITQRDLDEEFNINRASKRQNKNQATYGIWADSDEEAEDDDSRGKKKKNDYTAPIGFVKGGTQADATAKPTNKSNTKATNSNAKSKFSQKQSGFAGIRNTVDANDPSFGQWEAYTKGIGSKLLQKMGYQPGKGLGKNQQGITTPVEAKKRPGLGAIGAYGPEVKNPPLRKEEVEEIDIEIEEETVSQSWKKGQQKPKAKVKKVYIKSHEEFIEEGVFNTWNTKETETVTRMKIIDMTGPEQRLLSGLSQIHTARALKPKEDYHPTQMNTKFDVPELKQNIERLIQQSENRIIKGKQDYQRDLKHIEGLQEEKERLGKLINDERWQLEQLDTYDAFVQELEDISDDVDYDDSANMSFETIISKFETFYTEDFKKKFNRLLGLDDLVLCTFGPRLRKDLLFWKPFSNDDRIFKRYCQLKNIVCRPKTFDILLWDYWNPAVSRALQQWPSMKYFKPIMDFIEQWSPILPRWLYEYLIGSTLIPRITRDVEQWEPAKDPDQIDQWILPWLQVLLDGGVGHTDLEFLFEPIYEIIRQKLAKALGPWQPTHEDTSVYHMIKLWKDVFTEASFQNFVDINIVPKLEVMMQAMRINPLAQTYDEWNWIMTWRSMVTTNMMVTILEKCFFPNWLATLHNWLSQPMVNFVEVRSWYGGWKDSLGEFAAHSSIKDLLNKALMMMHHRVDATIGLKPLLMYYNLNAQPEVRTESVPPAPQLPTQPQPYVYAPQPTSEMLYTQSESINFKQMVEMKANESGILFMPIANRFQDGKQVFQFGQYLVYIDNQVLFLQKYVNAHRIWAPVRMQELIDMCQI